MLLPWGYVTAKSLLGCLIKNDRMLRTKVKLLLQTPPILDIRNSTLPGFPPKPSCNKNSVFYRFCKSSPFSSHPSCVMWLMSSLLLKRYTWDPHVFVWVCDGGVRSKAIFVFFFNVITFDDVHGFVGNHFVRCWFMYWSDLIPVNISAFGKYQLVAFHLRRSFSHCIFVEVSEAAFSFLLFIPAVDLTYLRVTGFVFASKRAYRHYHIIMHCARKLDTNWSQKLLLYFLVSHRL